MSIRSAGKKLAAQLASLRQALPDTRKEYTAVLAEIESIGLRVKYLKSAPLCADDSVALMVRALSEAKSAALRHGLTRQAWEWLVNSPSAAMENLDAHELGPLVAGHRPGEVVMNVLCATMDPSAVAEALRPAMHLVETQPPGPLVSERLAELGVLQDRLRELETEKADLAQLLASAGEDLDKYLPAPARTGPQPGDRLPPVKDHNGVWVSAVWAVTPMPGPAGADGHTTSGWLWTPCDPPDGEDQHYPRGGTKRGNNYLRR